MIALPSTGLTFREPTAGAPYATSSLQRFVHVRFSPACGRRRASARSFDHGLDLKVTLAELSGFARCGRDRLTCDLDAIFPAPDARCVHHQHRVGALDIGRHEDSSTLPTRDRQPLAPCLARSVTPRTSWREDQFDQNDREGVSASLRSPRSAARAHPRWPARHARLKRAAARHTSRRAHSHRSLCARRSHLSTPVIASASVSSVQPNHLALDRDVVVGLDAHRAAAGHELDLGRLDAQLAGQLELRVGMEQADDGAVGAPHDLEQR
jgi:hypothetical protein